MTEPTTEELFETVRHDLQEYQGLADYTYEQVHGFDALDLLETRMKEMEQRLEDSDTAHRQGCLVRERLLLEAVSKARVVIDEYPFYSGVPIDEWEAARDALRSLTEGEGQ